MIVFVIFFGGTNADISKYWVGIMILDILCCRSQQAFSVPPSSFYFFFCWRRQYPLWFLCETTWQDCGLLQPSLKAQEMHVQHTKQQAIAVILLVLSWKCSHVSRLLFCLYEEVSICRSKKKRKKRRKRSFCLRSLLLFVQLLWVFLIV